MIAGKYDAAKNSAGCYEVAIAALRERLLRARIVSLLYARAKQLEAA